MSVRLPSKKNFTTRKGGIILNENANKVLMRLKKNWGLYVLFLPAFILLICFSYMPMYGVIIAFKNFRPALGIWGSEWVWFDQFIKFFKSYQFDTTIKNTLVLSLYGLIVTFPLPIVFALVVNHMEAKRYKKLFQTVTYMPHFISTVVMVGILLLLLSPRSGLIGSLCALVGKQAPNLLGNAKAFSSLYVWSDVWQHTGWDSIIYIAALSAVDPSLYEAATMDGAGKWQKIKYIDIPMLMPTACTLLILRMGGILGVGFEKVYLMQNNLNISTSEVISTYVYKMGLLNNQYSFSAAVGLFNSVINFMLLILVNQITKKISNNSLW